jgi:hypothetical protein
LLPLWFWANSVTCWCSHCCQCCRRYYRYPMSISCVHCMCCQHAWQLMVRMHCRRIDVLWRVSSIYLASVITCACYSCLDHYRPVRVQSTVKILKEDRDFGESSTLLDPEARRTPSSHSSATALDSTTESTNSLCRPMPLSVWLIGGIRSLSAAPFYVFVSFAPLYIVEITGISSISGMVVATTDCCDY